MSGSAPSDMHSGVAELCSFQDLPAWKDDDHAAALATFSRHELRPNGLQYKQAQFGCAVPELLRLTKIALGIKPDQARAFFESNFQPIRIRAGGDSRAERSIVTAFFEPELEASRFATPEFNIPVHGRPKQLVDVKNQTVSSLPVGFRFGWRQLNGAITQAPDRAAIRAGALEGKSEIIAWLRDPVDVFFMHIQGSARLRFENGELMRITYAAKSGHPFTAIGSLLVEAGELRPGEVSMQSIANWLRAHPEQSQATMDQNQSYIFFKQMPVIDPALGPVAAAKIQLTPQRSLAVDMRYHTFATPIFVDADNVNASRCCRLVIAQETGTAIRGPVRGDLFFGTGKHAGELAGGVISAVSFFVLCPKADVSSNLSRWKAKNENAVGEEKSTIT